MIKEYKNLILSSSNPIMIHDGFESSMDMICDLLHQAGLRMHINSSLRNSIHVPGAIVSPAKMSNHLIGHAIDGNIILASGRLIHSTELERMMQEDAWDLNVRTFIQSIRDAKLRWGGDFRVRDVVHIDDALNVRHPDQWQSIMDELHSSI